MKITLIEVDLEGSPAKVDVLNTIGKVLGYTENQKWGKNWDAFNDIIEYLDKGGIYGKNEIILKPLIFSIKNWTCFSINEPEDFTILLSILNDKKSKYPGEFDFQLF